MKTFTVFFFLLIFSLNLYSLNWTRTYGGSGSEEGTCVIEDSEGYYVVCGWTNSFGAGGTDVYVLKVDSFGDTVWTRTYGGTGDDSGKEIFQTTDGGYIIAGNSNSFSAGGLNEIYVLRLDNSGDTVWTKTFGDTVNIYMAASDKLNDNGLIIGGNYQEPYYNPPKLICIDSIGVISWTTVLDTVLSGTASNFYTIHDIDLLNDNSFIIGGDFITLMKIANNGDIVWAYNYDSMDISYDLNAVETTQDNGFVYISHSSDGMYQWFSLNRVDSLGIPTWSKELSISKSMIWDALYILDMKRFNSNKYIMCGFKQANAWHGGLLNCCENVGPSFVGIFSNYDTIYEYMTFNSAVHLSGEGFLITGASNACGDLILLKTDSMGVFVEEEAIPQNPSNNNISVSSIGNGSLFTITLQENTDLKLSIYDVMGRLVSVPISSTLPAGIHEIPFTQEVPGMYFYRLESDGYTESGKFTVLR